MSSLLCSNKIKAVSKGNHLSLFSSWKQTYQIIHDPCYEVLLEPCINEINSVYFGRFKKKSVKIESVRALSR